MSWRDHLHLLPTSNRTLLAGLVGQRIVRLQHYAEEPQALMNCASRDQNMWPKLA